MAKSTRDLGKQGGMAGAVVAQPVVGPTPKTGFADAPDTEQMTAVVGPGIGGTTPAAH